MIKAGSPKRSHPSRMSAAEYVAQLGAKKRKYGNVPTVLNEWRFDSRREARRYSELLAKATQGEIWELQRQPRFVLAPAVRLLGEKRQKPAIIYTADFQYRISRTDTVVVEDVKSPSTAKAEAFRMKQHLMKSVHGIDVRIVR